MKKILLFSILFYSFSLMNAKVVYLDNTKEKNATVSLYNTFTDAYTACTSPSDTIYVIGAVDSYGSITIDKPIVLVGPGYFLEENTATQYSTLSANFLAIIFTSGSNGTIIKGIKQTNSHSNYKLFIQSDVDDLLIENCYIPEIEIQDLDGYIYNNIQIKKCYIWDNGITTSTHSNYDGIITNFVLSNNIIDGGVFLSNGSNGIISNNLFIANTFGIGVNSTFEVHNNILLADNVTNVTLPSLPNSSITHNISIINAFGSTNNNQELVNENFLFVGNEGYSTDGQYQLSENSPASGAGIGGIDAGPFSGSDPYRLSGLPDLPNIYELSTGGFVAGDELNVHIKAKQ